MKPIGTALTIFALCGFAQQQPDKLEILNSFVLSEKDAYFVAPPKLVLDSEVSDVMLSPDGRYGLVFGQSREKMSAQALLKTLIGQVPDVSARLTLKLWDTQSDHINDVSSPIADLLLKSFRVDTDGLLWTSQPGVVLLTSRSYKPNQVDQLSLTVYKVNFLDGSIKLLKTFDEREGPGHIVFPSPTKPFFVVTSTERNKPVEPIDLKSTVRYSVYDFNGQELKNGSGTVRGSLALFDWTKDGANMVGRTRTRKNAAVKPEQFTVVLNLTTGQINETSETISIFDDEEIQAPIKEDESFVELRNGTAKSSVRALWLSSTQRSEQPPVLVATDIGSLYWLAPKLNFIAYTVQGRLFSRDIAKMDMASFLAAKVAAQKEIAMNNAKQVAMGLIIYSSDCDDFFPPQANFKDGVMPYIKNESLLNNFVYTFKGGSATAIDSPATTEMGYVPVTGGRCVAYADGHVRFIKNP